MRSEAPLQLEVVPLAAGQLRGTNLLRGADVPVGIVSVGIVRQLQDALMQARVMDGLCGSKPGGGCDRDERRNGGDSGLGGHGDVSLSKFRLRLGVSVSSISTTGISPALVIDTLEMALQAKMRTDEIRNGAFAGTKQFTRL
jgi:hypothetical protein